MASDTRLTSTDQERPWPRDPSREGPKVPDSPGWRCPLASPPGQHSEYSSVDFSHLGRGLGGGGQGRGLGSRGTGQGAGGPQSSALRLQGYQRVVCIWARALRTLTEEAARQRRPRVLRVSRARLGPRRCWP